MNMDYEFEKWKEFDEIDTYNDNRLKGLINHSQGMTYGSLLIQEINGIETNQLIYTTPKLRYPCDRDQVNYSWAKGIKKIEAYEKLDGTNIYGYLYKDNEGNDCLSYKTRKTVSLSPDNKKYSFYQLWDEVLDMHPNLPELIYKNDMGLSFELYGRKNLIIVRYDDLINTKLLFGRDSSGKIHTPSNLNCGDVGHPELITTITEWCNLREEYEKIRNYLNENIRVEKREGDEIDLVEGLEGSVWYALSKHGIIQYKVKPDYILEQHTNKGIPNSSIYVTVKNAFEDMDEVTIDYVIDLLKEEYDDELIYKKIKSIENIVNHLNLQMKYRSMVLDEYERCHKKDETFDINLDKGKVMRHFAEKMKEWGFSKDFSSKIYQFIWNFYGKEAE